MKQLIIDLDASLNQSKKDQIIKMLQEMGIEFHTTERPTIEEYNKELEEAEKEIERGEFITAEELKKEARKW